MNTETKAATPVKTRCECHRFEIQTWTGEVPEGADPGDYAVYEGTGCTQTTERIFAPGHDAKLKSLLIKAGAAGSEIVRAEGGVNVYSSAEQVAKSYGFELQVLAGVKRAQAKAAERAEKKAAKASQKPSKKGVEVGAQIKVGRHFYDALIAPDGTAKYVTKGGVSKTAPSGKYSLAAETAK